MSRGVLGPEALPPMLLLLPDNEATVSRSEVPVIMAEPRRSRRSRALSWPLPPCWF